jgi:hypothetical protein
MIRRTLNAVADPLWIGWWLAAAVVLGVLIAGLSGALIAVVVFLCTSAVRL